MKINTNKQEFIKTSLILSGTTAVGTAAGWGCYKAKEKVYKKFVQTELKQLEQDNWVELKKFNKKCFETVRKNNKYKNQIDILEKEGKIFGRDYQLKDILSGAELKEYNFCAEQLSNILKKQNAEIISELYKQISKNKKISLVAGAVSGLLGGIGIKYLKQHIDTKKMSVATTKI